MTQRKYNPIIVKNRLKELRNEKGMTQKEVAEAIHFSVSTIKQYENGYRIPDNENLQILSAFYNVNPKYILGEIDFKNQFDKWNKTVDLSQLKFWENGVEIGWFPEIKSDDEYEDFVHYLKQYEERSEMKVRIDDIKVVTNANTNEIRENFETGEITIYAVSEADAEKGFRQLIKRGMIEE